MQVAVTDLRVALPRLVINSYLPFCFAMKRLSQKEMEKVVRRLADVEQPWNCPHGRPTMRHVGDIFPILQDDERMAEDHIAGATFSAAASTQPEEENAQRD